MSQPLSENNLVEHLDFPGLPLNRISNQEGSDGLGYELSLEERTLGYNWHF